MNLSQTLNIFRSRIILIPQRIISPLGPTLAFYQKNTIQNEKEQKMPHLNPLLRVFDHFVTKKFGGNKSLDAIVQPGPNTNSLTWT